MGITSFMINQLFKCQVCCYLKKQFNLFLLEWAKDPGKYCDQFWPGWDNRLKEVELIKPGFIESLKIKDIGKLLT